MKNWLVAIVVIIVFSVAASAGPGPSKKFSAKPKISDPEETDIVVSAWIVKTGLIDKKNSQAYDGLYFQKAGETAVNAYAYAQIRWLKNHDISGLTELGFDYRNGDHCTAVAPRFVIEVDDVEYSIGCTAGIASPAPDDVVNWTRVRFGLAELAAAGVPLTGTITNASVVFDEGTDAGTGSIILDNIDVNGSLIGKPGKAKAPVF